MNYTNQNTVEDLRIAYIGGGSRGWAWGLMSDLVSANDISGTVALYDINQEAAEHNRIIGEKFNEAEGAKSVWHYEVSTSLKEALTGADFVIISILPGTFDEMESDVHAPEKYGIYQSVGDTSGPGGIVRALRCLPMFQEIALAIKDYCPKAWVINYTNPMTMCVRTLYKTFPEIKAFGCCHEVFGTQKLLVSMLKDQMGIEDVKREEIEVEVTGINHFTWLTKAQYKGIDLFPVYAKFAKQYAETGFSEGKDANWMNSSFACGHRVKFDLFNKFGYIAAAGDRHLAEFCEGKWYLENPERVREMTFGLTTVAWRKEDLKKRLEKSLKRRTGEEPITLNNTGEDGVNQIRALLGLHTMVTNVNLPNKGQVPNLPKDAVIETNAVFRADHVTPVQTGDLPMTIYPLITRIIGEQEMVVDAMEKRDLALAKRAFLNDPLVTCGMKEAEKLFDEMVDNTKKYLTMYPGIQ